MLFEPVKPRKPDYCGIYRLIDPRNLETRYIGQSIQIQERFRQELREARTGTRKLPMRLWMAKLLRLDLEPILDIITECPAKDLDRLERAWIFYFRTQFPLHNVLNGGNVMGLLEYSASRIGIPRPPEWCANISAALKGKTFPHMFLSPSEDAKERIAIGNKITWATDQDLRARHSVIMSAVWMDPDQKARYQEAFANRAYGAKSCRYCSAEFIPANTNHLVCDNQQCRDQLRLDNNARLRARRNRTANDGTEGLFCEHCSKGPYASERGLNIHIGKVH